MATTYIGYYRPTTSALPIFEASGRESGGPPPEFREKINGFPASFPAGLKLIGSWTSVGSERPGIMIVEADDFSGLQHINSYYTGWLQFEWQPTATGGVPRNQ